MDSRQAQEAYIRVFDEVVGRLGELTDIMRKHMEVNPYNISWEQVYVVESLRDRLNEYLSRTSAGLLANVYTAAQA